MSCKWAIYGIASSHVRSEYAKSYPVPAEVQASYVVIIDSILAASDLNTITSKRIREGLQRAVDYDITPQKVTLASSGTTCIADDQHRMRSKRS